MAKKDEEQPRTFVEENLDDAYALRAEKKEVQDRIAANRDILRSLERAGKLDDSQSTELLELYPPRKRGEDDDDLGADASGDDAPPQE